jgi:hypothetical protein
MAMTLLSSLESLDFGLVHYAPELPPVLKQLTLKNEADNAISICAVVRNASAKDFPAIVKLIDADGIDITDESSSRMVADLPQEDIIISPRQLKSVFVVLLPFFLDRNPKTSARTSFVNISAEIDIIYRVEAENNSVPATKASLSLNATATLCTSILFVDDCDIEFINCLAGNTYVRDIQIWNRSECSLTFRICPVKDKDLQGKGKTSAHLLVFQEFDTSRVLQFDRAIQIAAFASKRIRLSFRAEVCRIDYFLPCNLKDVQIHITSSFQDLGETTVSYRIENVFNPLNSATVSCRINVIAKVRFL